MNNEVIVALFESETHARAAIDAVKAAGVPASAINQHEAGHQHEAGVGGGVADPLRASQGEAVAPERPHTGFWASLFGTGEESHSAMGERSRDRDVYQRSMSEGGSVVTIELTESVGEADRIIEILERHHPIDLEERASAYGLGGGSDIGTAPYGMTGSERMGAGAMAPPVTAGSTGAVGGRAGDVEQTIQLAEESVVVGKREVDRGRTRVRRYVVETPVEQDVTLRNETISVERRPVTGGERQVAGDAFTDKTLEFREMSEEAVVSKEAHVVEEVVIRKDVGERVETVRETVRKEEVDVASPTGTGRAGMRDPELH